MCEFTNQQAAEKLGICYSEWLFNKLRADYGAFIGANKGVSIKRIQIIASSIAMQDLLAYNQIGAFLEIDKRSGMYTLFGSPLDWHSDLDNDYIFEVLEC